MLAELFCRLKTALTYKYASKSCAGASCGCEGWAGYAGGAGAAAAHSSRTAASTSNGRVFADTTTTRNTSKSTEMVCENRNVGKINFED